ncbi:hypothetical protein GVY41_19795 [Frigidibacter albus]|uniref:PD(D/E)XK endonuclease domain-containing protein n=1 Tax=Frigidibacter albus TaxID=1465486 RepID=A0A6L8VNB7_9RHOB|nr:hypothetical protein [Frigidibacter albus]MZQ91321.1 hypothetical protein [Frigidibacter albus]NBE33239.1 hypothetical protein [Frigidibacter albus]GGH64002.1 hypothetical protein GCM10011341_39620 [Frigidibacter albus]
MPVQMPLANLTLPPVALHDAAAVSALWSFPDLDTGTLCHHAKILGEAGERFVDSMLLRLGLLPLALPEHSSADRLVLHPSAVLKLQIKTATAHRANAWHFNISKGYNHSPGGLRPYAAGDFDLLALVVLPENVVRFSRDRRSSQRIMRSEIAGLRADPRASLEEAMLALGLAAPAPPDIGLAALEGPALIP